MTDELTDALTDELTVCQLVNGWSKWGFWGGYGRPRGPRRLGHRPANRRGRPGDRRARRLADPFAPVAGAGGTIGRASGIGKDCEGGTGKGAGGRGRFEAGRPANAKRGAPRQSRPPRLLSVTRFVGSEGFSRVGPPLGPGAGGLIDPAIARRFLVSAVGFRKVEAPPSEA